MKKVLLTLTFGCFLSVTPGYAQDAVWCVNCSDTWTQQVDKVTNLEQLKNLIGSYQESMMQTQQQIQMVANQIKQYENMIQNTINLPQGALTQMKGQFSQLAKLTTSLNLQKGDYMAMGQVFDEKYPGLDIIKGMANGDSEKSVDEIWEDWSKEVDRSAQATFQVTGEQLKDLSENSEALDSHISSLLLTPEGQMQAIQSGNALAAIQVDEMRKMRMLMATNIQMATQMAMKDEKRKQLSKEQIDKLMDTNSIKDQYKGYF